MDDAMVRTRKWTRVEYERLAHFEILVPEDRVELLGGDVLLKEPQHSPHATAIQLAYRALDRAFGQAWTVRPQLPVALDEESEPEPDLCVVRGNPRDYRDAHPERPVLVVEIAMSRLGFDREHKGSLYARAAIGDYWIVNLPARLVEVYREPMLDATAPFGWRYRNVTEHGPAEHVSPLAVPTAAIAVSDLLP
jgi:Uma2 family endonuclease